MQRRNGTFCDGPKLEGMPFAICKFHAEKVCDYLHETPPAPDPRVLALRLAVDHRMAEGPPPEFYVREDRRKKAQSALSQVYYVKIHDHVKIGYTINLKARCQGLRVDTDAVLATEPGGRALESERHRQFAAERLGRREDFEPSRRLLAHIQDVLRENGPPNITDYVKTPWPNRDTDIPAS